jgi:hypothetical protein
LSDLLTRQYLEGIYRCFQRGFRPDLKYLDRFGISAVRDMKQLPLRGELQKLSFISLGFFCESLQSL